MQLLFNVVRNILLNEIYILLYDVYICHLLNYMYGYSYEKSKKYEIKISQN